MAVRKPSRRKAPSAPAQPEPPSTDDGPTDEEMLAMDELGLGVPDLSEGDGGDSDQAPLEQSARGAREAVPSSAGIVSFEEDRPRAVLEQLARRKLTPGPDWIRLICMRMGKPGRFTAGIHVWTPTGIQTLKCNPFSITPPQPPEFVRSVSKARPSSRKYGYSAIDFWPEPPKTMIDRRTGKPLPGNERGDCKNGSEWLYTDKISGQRLRSCPYANCPHHKPPAGIFHSVFQAQQFLSTLKTDSVIRAFIRDWDPRPDVAIVANLVLSQRAETLQEQMGLGGTANPNIIY